MHPDDGGEVDARTGTGEAEFYWSRGGVVVASSVHLGRDPAMSAGRPVTELLDRPFLTSDISVVKAA